MQWCRSACQISYAHSLCDSRAQHLDKSMRMNYDELARFKNLGCRDEGAWHRNCFKDFKGHERLENLGILSVKAGTTTTSAVADVTMFSHQPKIRSYSVVPIIRHGTANPQPLHHFWLWINALGGWKVKHVHRSIRSHSTVQTRYELSQSLR